MAKKRIEKIDYFSNKGTARDEEEKNKDTDQYKRLENDEDKYEDRAPSVIRYKVKVIEQIPSIVKCRAKIIKSDE